MPADGNMPDSRPGLGPGPGPGPSATQIEPGSLQRRLPVLNEWKTHPTDDVLSVRQKSAQCAGMCERRRSRQREKEREREWARGSLSDRESARSRQLTERMSDLFERFSFWMLPPAGFLFIYPHFSYVFMETYSERVKNLWSFCTPPLTTPPVPSLSLTLTWTFLV